MGSEHPAALYARRHWMGERSRALGARVRDLLELRRQDQHKDGSFGDLRVTIERLFELLLLDAGHTEMAQQGVNFLMELRNPTRIDSQPKSGATQHLFLQVHSADRRSLVDLNSCPFIHGDAGLLKSSAALFFASHFGRVSDLRVVLAFKDLDALAKQGDPLWCAPSCAVNVLQAYAAHPKWRRGRLAWRVSDWFRTQQSDNGRWKAGIPFLRSLWALSHIPGRPARDILHKATPSLVRSQREDGAWGRKYAEFNTWLALSIMKREGMIP